MTITRRSAVFGATILAALPVAGIAAPALPEAAGPATLGSDAIRRLWDEAIDLSIPPRQP